MPLLVLYVFYFQCSVQSYQAMGDGHYGKGPIALPETSLCKFIENDTVVYPSLRRATNLPRTCPLKKVNMPLVKAVQALVDSIIKWCVVSRTFQRNQSFKSKSTNLEETLANWSNTKALKIKLKHVYQKPPWEVRLHHYIFRHEFLPLRKAVLLPSAIHVWRLG